MRIAVEEPLHGGGKGGVTVYTRNLIRELARLDPGGEYLLFSYFFRGHSRRLLEMRPRDGSRYGLLIPRWPESLVRRAEWGLGLPVVESYLKLKDVGLFHAHRVPRRKWVPTVVTVHDLFPVVHPEWTSDFLIDMWERILRPGMERVDKVLAVSQNTKKDLVERWSVPEEKIVVTHEGVDREIFRPLAKERSAEMIERFGLPERFVLTIGPFDSWCDPSNIVRAVGRLPKALKDVGLVFAGQPGSCAGEVKRLAAQSGLAERCIWTGYVEQTELVALYNRADVLVYPSFYEGFGLPVLEAMACGTAVVTSDAASLPEVAGDAGLLVDPGDVEALFDALRRLLVDRSYREDLEGRGIERAKAFTWMETARKTLAVYQEVLG